MNKPVLLLIPGLLNTPAVFDRLRTHLDPAIDLRIASVHTQASLAAMAADAWALLADLPAQQPVVIAGFSMGGYVAWQMLANAVDGADGANGANGAYGAGAPRPVQGLALINTSARADTPEGLLNREKAITAMATDFDKFVDGLCRLALTPAGHADAVLLAEVQALMRCVGPVAASAQTRALLQRPDRRPWLPTLRLACQVVGGADDAITLPAWSQEMADLIPGARLALLPGMGHMLPLERPAELAALLHSLLQRVSPAIPTA